MNIQKHVLINLLIYLFITNAESLIYLHNIPQLFPCVIQSMINCINIQPSIYLSISDGFIDSIARVQTYRNPNPIISCSAAPLRAISNFADEQNARLFLSLSFPPPLSLSLSFFRLPLSFPLSAKSIKFSRHGRWMFEEIIIVTSLSTI